MSERQCVVAGKEFKHLPRKPGMGATELMMQRCYLEINRGLRLDSDLPWVKQGHNERKTVGAGSRGNLWEISLGTQEIKGRPSLSQAEGWSRAKVREHA